MSKVSNTVAAKVFKEVYSNFELSCSLSCALWTYSLHTLDKELEDFWVVHALYNFAIYFT